MTTRNVGRDAQQHACSRSHRPRPTSIGSSPPTCAPIASAGASVAGIRSSVAMSELWCLADITGQGPYARHLWAGRPFGRQPVPAARAANLTIGRGPHSAPLDLPRPPIHARSQKEARRGTTCLTSAKSRPPSARWGRSFEDRKRTDGQGGRGSTYADNGVRRPTRHPSLTS